MRHASTGHCSLREAGHRRQYVEFALGVSCLVAGALVYLFARPQGDAWLIGSLPATHARVSTSVGRLFGQVPTLAHVIAFSLMTAATLKAGRRAAIAACTTWAAIDIAFECAQQRWLAMRIAAVIPFAKNPGSFCSHARAYFLTGRFDWYDVLAAIVGAAVAFTILTIDESAGRRGGHRAFDDQRQDAATRLPETEPRAQRQLA
jgi:hypothetical protein